MTMQTTLKDTVRAVGTGLHSGDLIEMQLKPAAPNTGVVFVRTDLAGASVKASIDNIDFSMLQLATTLRNGEAMVQTTEHLMSALYAAGVDNVIVELSAPEVPIMDGSAEPFLMLIEEAGIKQQLVPCNVLEVIKPFQLEHEGKTLSVVPNKEFKVSYEINFDHPLIRKQCKTVTVGKNYDQQIAPARTFGFLKDVNYLQSIGLIKGGSLENAIVLDGDRVLNESLRLEDEFVSHKILDLIGDFSVSGYRIKGHFTAARAGHEVHARFMKALLESDCVRLSSEAVEDVAMPVPLLTAAVA